MKNPKEILKPDEYEEYLAHLANVRKAVDFFSNQSDELEIPEGELDILLRAWALVSSRRRMRRGDDGDE
jgi:hypothetical protein